MFQFILNMTQSWFLFYFFFPTDGGSVLANLGNERLRPLLEAKIGFWTHFLYGRHLIIFTETHYPDGKQASVPYLPTFVAWNSTEQIGS